MRIDGYSCPPVDRGLDDCEMDVFMLAVQEYTDVVFPLETQPAAEMPAGHAP